MAIRKHKLDVLRADTLEERFSPPDRGNISLYYKKPLETALVVVHPGWHGASSKIAKLQTAMEDLVEKFRELKKPVVVLVGAEQLDTAESRYEGSFQVPPKIWTGRDVTLFSVAGEHTVQTSLANVVMTGIFLEACLHNAMVDVIDNYFQNALKSELTIHLPDRAIRSMTDSTIADRIEKEGVDGFYQEYVKKAFRHDGKFCHIEDLSPSMNPCRVGTVFLDEYQFHISIHGKEFPHLGDGKRIVNLKVWPHDQFINKILPNLK